VYSVSVWFCNSIIVLLQPKQTFYCSFEKYLGEPCFYYYFLENTVLQINKRLANYFCVFLFFQKSELFRKNKNTQLIII
jgi:hypothetical protein